MSPRRHVRSTAFEREEGGGHIHPKNLYKQKKKRKKINSKIIKIFFYVCCEKKGPHRPPDATLYVPAAIMLVNRCPQ